MDEAQGRASADYGTGDFDEDKSQNRFSKCHRFCSQCKCKKKKNLNEKERPQQALERGLGISHGERYSSLCLAQILIYTYSVLLIIISLGLSWSFFLAYTHQVLIHHCRMAHPTFPLLETFYDSKHRAHVLVDRGEVSITVSQ